MSIETNPIVSGQTMLVPEALPKWIYDEKVILSD